MSAHIIDGEFQSDKYPTTPRGKVPLSVRDPTAQDLLWEYAQRRRGVDTEFSDDLESCLLAAGYVRRATERIRSVVQEACERFVKYTVRADEISCIASRVAEQLVAPVPSPLTPDEVKHLRHHLADWRIGYETSVRLVERLLDGAAAPPVGLSAEERELLGNVRLQLLNLMEHAVIKEECWTDEFALLDRLLTSHPASSLQSAVILPPHKEWDSDAHDRSEQADSGDYVEGWNDALNAAMYRTSDLHSAIAALLDSDAPAGDLRSELAKLIGRM